ncbi:hypothetical protein RDABS01_011087 [Bienertia sinuspersici]
MVIRKSRKKIFIIICAITCFITLSHHLYRYAHHSFPAYFSPPPLPLISTLSNSSQSISIVHISSQPSLPPPKILSTISILIPDWEVLVIIPPEKSTQIILPLGNNYVCLFPNNVISSARLLGKLPFNGGYAFKCEFPMRNRRRLPFFQPILVFKEEQENLYFHQFLNAPLHLLRWNFIVYDSFTTKNDIVLFVKGVNNRQGVNRPPSDFRCVFGDEPLTAVRTNITSSVQEVFRCPRPEITGSHPISVTVEILENDRTVMMPTLARYVPDNRRTIIQSEGKSLMCACTMVHNVGKFLREWVMFHSKIGVEKFVLYDNDSDDDLVAQVESLRKEGFDVRTIYWVWPKAQEAGFSHCALYSTQICDWAAFFDVDEFVFSPTWLESAQPNIDMLRSLLPADPDVERVGQISIQCYEFGPSGQIVHPIDGVTQGYTCRRRFDQRHKSIVYLPVVDQSLLNVVHHFRVKDEYRSIQIEMDKAIVNHYKYQAWPEFQSKFRRRVSAYVIDWRENMNLMSNDRAPGLGFQPIEPLGWTEMFCEVRDERMKMLTKRWFGVNGHSIMAWQSS